MYMIDFKPENQYLQYIFAFFGGHTDWAYFPVIPWLAYILTGIAFRCFLEKQPELSDLARDVKILWIIIPGTILLLLSLPWASSITWQLEGENGYYHHSVWFFGWNFYN